jgi:hypothetical protein
VRPNRRILSLFGCDEGLGVFGIHGSGQVTGAWLDDFHYDLLRRGVYDPWERLVERALNDGDPEALALAGSLMPQPPLTALADADGHKPLPFARCEAILSGASENLMIREDVTVDAVSAAFAREGILLFSLHGDFDEENPFQSKIVTADGDLPLHQLLLEQTTGHWYSVAHGERTLAVRSERSRASGEVEEQAGCESGGLRLRFATLRPNGDGINC